MKPFLIKNKEMKDKLENICKRTNTKCYIIKDNDILSLTGHQLREWKDKIETELKEKLIKEEVYHKQVKDQDVLHLTNAYAKGFKDGKKTVKQWT